jgi:hypothetical protein
MEKNAISLLAAYKTTAAYGTKYVADFGPASLGGQQFAIISSAIPATATLASTQVSGSETAHSGVVAKVAGRLHLRADLAAISEAAHSLVLLGTTGLAGKFLMPRGNGDQKLLNTARAHAADAVAFSAPFITLGLPTDFIAHLNADIAALEAAIGTKGAGQTAQGGATGGIEDTVHKAAIALHVVNTIVRNTYKNNPTRLAEWLVASHVEKHTPVPRPPKPTPPPHA